MRGAGIDFPETSPRTKPRLPARPSTPESRRSRPHDARRARDTEELGPATTEAGGKRLTWMSRDLQVALTSAAASAARGGRGLEPSAPWFAIVASDRGPPRSSSRTASVRRREAEKMTTRGDGTSTFTHAGFRFEKRGRRRRESARRGPRAGPGTSPRESCDRRLPSQNRRLGARVEKAVCAAHESRDSRAQKLAVRSYQLPDLARSSCDTTTGSCRGSRAENRPVARRRVHEALRPAPEGSKRRTTARPKVKANAVRRSRHRREDDRRRSPPRREA